MEVILHIGAHRTASASFGHYLTANRHRLERLGIGYWGPARDPDADMHCLSAEPAKNQFVTARKRIRRNLEHARRRGIRHLVIRDENIAGTMVGNLSDCRLYGAIGERMARFGQVFEGALTRLVMSTRSQDTYWGSVAAHAVARGHRVPERKELAAISASRRQWRDVLIDLACAVPEVEIQVQPYETLGGMPERRLSAMTGLTSLPATHAREWLRRAPRLDAIRKHLTDRGADPAVLPAGEGRWHPFNRDQVMALREAYADDLYWLRAGADGLVTLIEETAVAKAGTQPPVDGAKRGQADGKDDRRLA